MPTPILMPALSPTMEKGKIAKWLKKEGDAIHSGDVIAEIETDKATMEVEAVDEGRLGRILVAEGTEDVPVNTEIAILLGEGEKADTASAAKAPPPQPSPARGKGATPAPAPKSAPTPEAKAAPKPEAKPAPPSPAAGEGRAGGIAAQAPSPQKSNGSRIFASPLARRIAKEKGLDIALIQGSGPHGRIVLRDVESAKPAAKTPSPLAGEGRTGGLATPPSDEAIRKLFEEGSYEVIPHDTMRKVIARRLTEAKQTIPHFYLNQDCEIDELLTIREKINAAAPTDKEGKPAFKLSINDFVIKALALALQRVPDANVTWTEGGMLKHKYSDVGVAVAIPGGLITPIVRKAESKSLSGISLEMKDYAARARARKLLPHEYQGGSTAVSNLGMYGIPSFSAVINPPQSTILAVGVGVKRPVVVKDEVKVRTVMTVTLSTDHRSVDGAVGAQLVAVFKTLIEEPLSMLV